MQRSANLNRLARTGALLIALLACRSSAAAPDSRTPRYAGAPESMSAAELGGAYTRAAQDQADPEAQRRAQAARTATEIASYLDIRPDGSIDFLVNSVVEGAPPGVTQSVGFQLDREQDDFEGRLVKALKLIAEGMPQEKLNEHDESSPLIPVGRVILRPDEAALFAHVVAVIETCGRPDVRLWNIAFEKRTADGETLRIAAPLPRGAPSTAGPIEAGQTRALDVQLSVMELDGEPTAAGKRERMVVYTLTFPEQPAGQGTVSTGLALSSVKALASALQKPDVRPPEAPITLSVDDRTTFGEALAVLKELVANDLTPTGFGRVDG